MLLMANMFFIFTYDVLVATLWWYLGLTGLRSLHFNILLVPGALITAHVFCNQCEQLHLTKTIKMNDYVPASKTCEQTK